ncbi:MAG: DUF4886 domain-containing protein [Thiolinea sp.]
MPKRVLFFGNSFTYYNNSLHYHLERMVHANTDKTAFREYEFKAITISGGKLAEHREIAAPALAMEPWDVVILQAHSREAIDEEMAPALYEAIDEINALTRQSHSKAMLFMTWAYQHQPEMIKTVSQAYADLGTALELPVIPVGLAFSKALESYPALKLHTPDKVHPSPAGTYLAAATLYAAIYQQSPVGNRYTMWLQPEQAIQLQEIAWATVQEYQQIASLQQTKHDVLFASDREQTLTESSNQAPSTEKWAMPQEVLWAKALKKWW